MKLSSTGQEAIKSAEIRVNAGKTIATSPTTGYNYSIKPTTESTSTPNLPKSNQPSVPKPITNEIFSPIKSYQQQSKPATLGSQRIDSV